MGLTCDTTNLLLDAAMLKTALARIQQGHRTLPYPKQPAILPDRFLGAPKLNGDRCGPNCASCVDSCPTDALTLIEGRPRLDLGRCLFCGECARSCERGAIEFSREYRLSAALREELVVDGAFELRRASAEKRLCRLFGRSLALRQVSAGGCNACEADINVLTTLAFDLGRFGIQITASPRHADGLIVTGPVTQNMRLALEKTYAAVPEPKLVIAVGACAISGGPYAGHPEVCSGVAEILPVDLFIPGCPPHPNTILDGLLTLIGRLERGVVDRPAVAAQ